MSESIYQKKKRVRPPRVHITYDVELRGAMVQKEIPFVVGVISDLSGKPKEKLPKLKERKFVEIDRDSFDDVLAKMAPRVAMKVDNKLQDDGTQLAVELLFKSMEDFSPDQIAKRVKPLNDLLEIRNKLKDLLSRTEGNDRLEELLDTIMNNTEVRDKLRTAFGGDGPGDSASAAPASPEDSSDPEGGSSQPQGSE